MKPLDINLVGDKPVLGKTFLALLICFSVFIIGFTGANILQYSGNKKEIKGIESRIETINRREAQGRQRASIALKKDSLSELEYKQDLAFLGSIIKRHTFPLSMVLSEIEKVKPEMVNIDKLSFSETLDRFVIKGESGQVGAISQFVIRLYRSGRFDIELTREEIREDKKIDFELTAKWVFKG